MKNITLVPLYGAGARYAGWIVAAAAGLAWATGGWPAAAEWLPWAMVLGLTLAAAGRQRTETDRTRLLRGIASRAAFFLQVALLLAVAFMERYHAPVHRHLLLIAGTGLAFHQALFHGMLYFGPEAISDHQTLAENIRENGRFYRTLAVVIAVTLLTIAFFASR